LLDLGNFTEALATTLKALTFDSFNPDALELKIRALLGLRRFAEVATESPTLCRGGNGKSKSVIQVSRPDHA